MSRIYTKDELSCKSERVNVVCCLYQTQDGPRGGPGGYGSIGCLPFIQRPLGSESVGLFSCCPVRVDSTAYIISAIKQTKRLQQKATETIPSVHVLRKMTKSVSKISIYMVVTV